MFAGRNRDHSSVEAAVTGQWKTIRDIVLIGPLGIVGLLGGVFAVPFMVMRVMADKDFDRFANDLTGLF
jgi:hypothetical protein